MLSAAQMEQMSRLLEETLELHPAGRRRWLEALSAEYRDLEPALGRRCCRKAMRLHVPKSWPRCPMPVRQSSPTRSAAVCRR